MTSLLAQQQTLLAKKVRALERIRDGLTWSLERLPAPQDTSMGDPATAERVAAIVDRFRKLQDHLAGAMGRAHAMIGERRRNFNDVATWAVSERILPTASTWLALRSRRNRLTHEYDLAGADVPELVTLIRLGTHTLTDAIQRLIQLCTQRGLI